MDIKYSDYQLDIFKDVENGSGHTIVDALAGSGKTRTLIESLKYVPSGLRWVLLAFNTRIAGELKIKAPNGGEINTLHSFGLKALGATFRNIIVDNDKLDCIVQQVVSEEDLPVIRFNICKTISLVKGLLAETDEEIDNIIDDYEIICDIDRTKYIRYIQEILLRCRAQYSIVDFDDMIWLNHVLATKVTKFDFVFVDESQDLNRGQLSLILKASHPVPKTKRSRPEGRIIMFGDKFQAIHSFTGSELDLLDKTRQQINAKSLPLSITYRCPISVVKEAQKFVPHLEAAPNAIQGKVAYINTEEMKRIARPGCYILSRKNAPLVLTAFSFIKDRIPVNIQGRDLGDNMLNLIRDSRADSIDELMNYLYRWRDKEVARLSKKNKNTDHIFDKVGCFEALVENIFTIPDLAQTIKKLFSDINDRSKIMLSSVHRAKGDEREVVFMLLSTFSAASQEERNIKYVAITRSKCNLYYVLDKPTE